MLYIVAAALIFMIVKTFMSFGDKEMMDKYNESGIFGAILIFALIAEVAALIWVLNYEFTH